MIWMNPRSRKGVQGEEIFEEIIATNLPRQDERSQHELIQRAEDIPKGKKTKNPHLDTL